MNNFLIALGNFGFFLVGIAVVAISTTDEVTDKYRVLFGGAGGALAVYAYREGRREKR